MDELMQSLTGVADGQRMGLPYELVDDLFSPGIEDICVKTALHDLARANGCSIEDRPDERVVYFIKGA